MVSFDVSYDDFGIVGIVFLMGFDVTIAAFRFACTALCSSVERRFEKTMLSSDSFEGREDIRERKVRSCYACFPVLLYKFDEEGEFQGTKSYDSNI